MNATPALRLNRVWTLLLVGAALVCVLEGGAIVGGMPILNRTVVRAVVGGVPLLVAVVLLIVALGYSALPFWIAASPLVYPFLRYPSHSGGLVTFDRIWLVGLMVAVLRMPRPRTRDRAANFMWLTMVIFATAYGVRLLLPPHGDHTQIRYWFDALVLPIGAFVVTRRQVFTDGDERVLRGLIIAGVVMSVISVAELLFGFQLASLSGGTPVFDQAAGVARVSGPFASNAASSTATLVCLAAVVYWTQTHTGAARRVGVLASVIIVAGALASFHRAAGLGVVAILILGTTYGARDRTKRILTLAMIGVVAALGFYVVSASIESSTFYQGRVASGSNVIGRFASWEQSIAIFKTSPVFGVGPGQAPVIQQQEGLFSINGQSAASTLHSSFLTSLAELGVIGFTAFLLQSAAVIRLMLAVRRRAASRRDELLFGALFGGGVAFLIMSLTLTIVPESPANLAFAVLLGVGAGRLDRHAEDQRVPLAATPAASAGPMVAGPEESHSPASRR